MLCDAHCTVFHHCLLQKNLTEKDFMLYFTSKNSAGLYIFLIYWVMLINFVLLLLIFTHYFWSHLYSNATTHLGTMACNLCFQHLNPSIYLWIISFSPKRVTCDCCHFKSYAETFLYIICIWSYLLLNHLEPLLCYVLLC